MRKVEQIMGMPISIDIPGCDKLGVFEIVFNGLREIDQRFSPYREDSEVSKFRDGKLSEKHLSQDLKDIIYECKKFEKLTNGYFSAYAAGAFNPTGYVKGWAIVKAGKAIEKQGYKTYCIGAGGDILARSNSAKTWQIGIQDPQDKSKILNMLSISSGAVATSGNYERGQHIIDPKTKKTANELLSITIIGQDIVMADVLATAGFAMGKAAAGFIKKQKGYKAVIVDKTGQISKIS